MSSPSLLVTLPAPRSASDVSVHTTTSPPAARTPARHGERPLVAALREPGPRGPGQWFTSERGTRWWFDSGSLALDLAHTGRVGTGPTVVRAQLGIEDPATLDAWLATRLPCSPAVERDVLDAHALREAVGALAVAGATGRTLPRQAVELLNLVAAMPDVPPRLAGGTRQAGRTLPKPQQALASMAREAVAVFSGAASGRLAVCDAPECGLVYFDTSRAGTRRWCSMDRCGNRHKVRAHRARLAERGGLSASHVSPGHVSPGHVSPGHVSPGHVSPVHA